MIESIKCPLCKSVIQYPVKCSHPLKKEAINLKYGWFNGGNINLEGLPEWCPRNQEKIKQ